MAESVNEDVRSVVIELPQPGGAGGAGGAPAAAGAFPMAGPGSRPLWRSLLKLARPTQWVKGGFVAVGPFYAVSVGAEVAWLGVVGAFLAFGFAASSCYVINDIKDREADRAHPRKCRRPLASREVGVRTALWFALALLGASIASVFLADPAARWWLATAVGVYMLNVTVYSLWVKHAAIIDVISLASGFVLRVLGGCAAAMVAPSSWLLNCIFFLSMFLAFGKRLGERRTLGEGAASARGVQSIYTDSLLQMSVVVTAVATLITYAGYVQSHEQEYTLGFNLLWLTMLPATYGLLRCIVLLERGDYDDPTELAGHDRPFQASVLIFGLVTGALFLLRHGGPGVQALGMGGAG